MLLVCLYFVYLVKKKVPSCSCFQTLLPKCTVYSIYIYFIIKTFWTTMSYNGVCSYGEGLGFGEQRAHHVIISSLLTYISIFWSDWTWRSAQCIFGQMCFRYKGQILLWKPCFTSAQSVAKCPCKVSFHVTLCPIVVVLHSVWRCFPMQIHCYSTICVNCILYEKNIVPNICKIEELSIPRLYVNCYILCIPE